MIYPELPFDSLTKLVVDHIKVNCPENWPQVVVIGALHGDETGLSKSKDTLQVGTKDPEMSEMLGGNATGSTLKSEGSEISGDWPFIIMGVALGMIFITISIVGQPWHKCSFQEWLGRTKV